MRAVFAAPEYSTFSVGEFSTRPPLSFVGPENSTLQPHNTLLSLLHPHLALFFSVPFFSVPPFFPVSSVRKYNCPSPDGILFSNAP